jgi:hypothetical protein
MTVTETFVSSTNPGDGGITSTENGGKKAGVYPAFLNPTLSYFILPCAAFSAQFAL